MNTADRGLSKWRKSTWVLVGLIALWAVLFMAWFIVPDSGTDEAQVLAARGIHFGIWAIGFAFSLVLWGMYRWYAIEVRQRRD
jgi:hypothetical protein